MIRINNPNSERKKLLKKARDTISDVREIITRVQQIDNIKEKEAVNILEELRKGCSENLNQIPHDFMILRARECIEEEYYRGKDIEWFWNPNRIGSKPGGEKEPDLIGKIKGRTVVSAEITTAAKRINKTMVQTIDKLRGMPGKKIYFVETEKMERSARKEVSKPGYRDIEVKRI